MCHFFGTLTYYLHYLNPCASISHHPCARSPIFAPATQLDGLDICLKHLENITIWPSNLCVNLQDMHRLPAMQDSKGLQSRTYPGSRLPKSAHAALSSREEAGPAMDSQFCG
jgi:hypothetical protein